MNRQKKVCVCGHTVIIIMIHLFLCTLRLCHAVKSSLRDHTNRCGKPLPRRQTEMHWPREQSNKKNTEGDAGMKRKTGTTGSSREEETTEKKNCGKTNKTHLKLSFLCTVTYISYTLPWGTAPAGTNKLTPAGGRTGGEAQTGAEIIGFISGFIHFNVHGWIIERANRYPFFSRLD